MYFLSFRWTDGISRLSEAAPGEINLFDDDENAVPIKYMTPTPPTKAVGVWQDAAGKSGKQLEEIIDKVREVHAHLTTSPLSHHIIWIGLKQAIWRSIEYVLPAALLNVKDCKLLAK